MNSNELLNAPEFGDHITKADGDSFFKNANFLIEKSMDLLNKAFIGDQEILDFYARPCYGYVFSKEILEGLLTKMDSNDHYLVLLNGYKGPGKKTLMAFVYKSNGDNLDLDTRNIKAFAGKIGTQHPGIIRKVIDAKEVPIKINVSDLEE
jgi:hypothetical protein